MTEPTKDSCLPKKQRRRNEALLDSTTPIIPQDVALMDCDDQDSTTPAISYKDILTRGTDTILDDDIRDDDIDFLEDDVRMGEANGIAFIVFSDWVKGLTIKSIKFTLVSEILGTRVGYTTFTIELPYKHSLIKAIGARISKVVKIDYQTDYGYRWVKSSLSIETNLACTEARLHATTYFSDLFVIIGPPLEPFLISGLFPTLDEAVHTSLATIPLGIEIKVAIFSMAPLNHLV
ncbi:hypothetical protein V6N12_065736 [Hibiscus sabdariffa]|uniref:Uncharacterized protein n=1 Tax=Hibiscus sabdariffa TaxID=183260 RepID=A0ABR2G9W8_9ROSI